MILYFDTETTSLFPGNICQISYVMQYKDKIIAKNRFFTVDFVEKGAFMVHGFSVEVLKKLSNGFRFNDNADEIQKDFDEADLIVAHNVAFDLGFLRAEFSACGKQFTYKREFCSMKKMTPVCALPRSSGVGYKYPKLSELCSHFGVSDEIIGEESSQLFKQNTFFHDARFDATAVYLSVNKSLELEQFKELKEFL